MKELHVEPLTREEFAPFGDVIETNGRDLYHINNGQVERYHALSTVDVTSPDVPFISIFRAQPAAFPIKIDLLERHPLSSQAIIPLDREPLLVIVAKGNDDQIDISSIRAFISNGNQGINYFKNIWHFPVFSLNKVSDMLVVDRGGSDNCVVLNIDEPQLIKKFYCRMQEHEE